jgi:hypothetical protein
MVLQHAKSMVAVGSGDAIEVPALGERHWKRGITIAGGLRTTRKLGDANDLSFLIRNEQKSRRFGED